MDFCKKCGTVMTPKTVKKQRFLACRKCGHKIKHYKPLEIEETVKKKPSDEVIVIEKNEEVLPKTRTVCPKCGHKEAIWWLRQTRSGDEAPTLFLRCTKCRFSWREYG